MEPTKATIIPSNAEMDIFLGEYEVVESPHIGAVAIHLGRNICIHIHLGDFSDSVRRGDKLPLFTRMKLKQKEPR